MNKSEIHLVPLFWLEIKYEDNLKNECLENVWSLLIPLFTCTCVRSKIGRKQGENRKEKKKKKTATTTTNKNQCDLHFRPLHLISESALWVLTKILIGKLSQENTRCTIKNWISCLLTYKSVFTMAFLRDIRYFFFPVSITTLFSCIPKLAQPVSQVQFIDL